MLFLLCLDKSLYLLSYFVLPFNCNMFLFCFNTAIGQLCLLDKDAMGGEASSSSALPDSLIAKIDDCLAWIQQSKTSSKKVLTNEAVGQGATLLKENLKKKVQELLKFQLNLEEFKVIGSQDQRAVKGVLQACSNSCLYIYLNIQILPYVLFCVLFTIFLLLPT